MILFLIIVSGCQSGDQLYETSSEPGNVVSIPEKIQNNCIGFVIGGPEEIELISSINGGWARPHPGPFAWNSIEPEKGKFDFSETDEWVRTAQENNVAILATVWPYASWDQKVCHDSSCEVTNKDIFYPKFGHGIPVSRCAPCSYEDYKAFLTKLVERYDGDGSDDMPGLIIPIKYWEILNEPEMGSEEMTFFKGNAQEYSQILKEGYSAVKSACSDCKVLHGGMAGTADFMKEYWSNVFSGSKDFDIGNIHFIKRDDVTSLNVNKFKEFLSANGVTKSIWVTEAEYDSESQVESSFRGALSAGAEKVFFTQFKVGEFGMPSNGEYSQVYNNLEC